MPVSYVPVMALRCIPILLVSMRGPWGLLRLKNP